MPSFTRQLPMLAILMLLGLTIALASAENFVWIEGEEPSAIPTQDAKTIGYSMHFGNRPAGLSGGRALSMAIDPKQQAAVIPASGLLFGYDFELATAGSHDVWARIGFEWARSDFNVRLDQGEWNTLAHTQATQDVVGLGDWNEMAWIKLTTATLTAGKHTIAIRHLPTVEMVRTGKGNNAKTEAQPRRTLFALDAICVMAAGSFRPNGAFKPGEDWRNEQDRAAAATTFVLPAAPAGQRSQVDLEGLWEVARWDENIVDEATRKLGVEALPEDYDQLFWTGIETPANKDVARPDLKLCHRLIYRTRVDVPADMTERGWILEFDQFNLIASVFVNGQYCGWSRAHDTIWRCDVSQAVVAGKRNEIAVVLKDKCYSIDTTRENDQTIRDIGLRWYYNYPWMYDINWFGVKLDMLTAASIHMDGGHSGLLDPVRLIAAGKAYADEVFVKPSVSQKSISLDCTVANQLDRDAEFTVQHALVPWDAAGKWQSADPELRLAAVTVPVKRGGMNTCSVSSAWADPALWWPEEPNLYMVVTTISANGTILDTKYTRFGFREWGWKQAGYFTLNGKPWQFWEQGIKAKDPEAWLAKAKEYGVNSFRTWGNQRWGGWSVRQLLDYFDEQGIVVRDGLPFDGEVANWPPGGLTTNDRKEFQPALREDIENVHFNWVRGKRNHPSILIWSLENEVTYISANNLGQGPVYEPVMRIIADEVMQLDPTRPTMVDGGNAMRSPDTWIGPDQAELARARQLGYMPVNGTHYIESGGSMGAEFADYPDAAYTADHWYASLNRGVFPMAPGIPIFHGEVFAYGADSAIMSSFGGEICFQGEAGTYVGRSIFKRMIQEGYRYGRHSGAWAFGDESESPDLWPIQQPVAVLGREWDSAFASGATVKRTFRLSNQSHIPGALTVQWQLTIAGRPIDQGNRIFTPDIGGFAEFTLDLTMPQVAQRTPGDLTITVARNNQEIFRDVRPLHVIDPHGASSPVLPAGQKLFVFDPSGEASARLRARNIAFQSVASWDKMPLGSNAILIGRDAIPAAAAADTFWQRLLVSGARILVLEQDHPLRYQALPADLELSSGDGRISFAIDLNASAMDGLGQSDFFCWSGDHRSYKKPYRKSSRGARFLAQCGQDLAETPLAEMELADGLLVVSQYLLGEKLSSDPVAQRLFDNLVTHVAGYRPLRVNTSTVLAAQAPESAFFSHLGLQASPANDPMQALQANTGLAIMQASPENLKILAANSEQVRRFAEQGGWLMLLGLTPDGLVDFNRLVGVEHLIRPFTSEAVDFHQPKDTLASQLSLRDLVMTSGQRIEWWKSTQWRDQDAFGYIVDIDEVGPFCTINGQDPSVPFTTWPQPRNLVNGVLPAEFWRYTCYFEADKGVGPSVKMVLPRPERLHRLDIAFDTAYGNPDEITLSFDDGGEPLVFTTKPDDARQSFAFEPRQTTVMTLKISGWTTNEKGRDIPGIGALWLYAQRSDTFRQRVHPLTNIGGLVRYQFGKGGIVLNQLKILEREKNPDNALKKGVITKTILSQLGAVFSGANPVLLGTGLTFSPLTFEPERYNTYIYFNNKPGWFQANGISADFTALPRDQQRFGGVDYHIFNFQTSPLPNCFTLKGAGTSVETPEIKDLPIGKKADALFFLHTYNPGPTIEDYERKMVNPEQANNAENLPVLFSYFVQYADGQRLEIPVEWNKAIGSWYCRTQPGNMLAAVPAWTAPAADGKHILTAWSMQWNNPRPEVAIQSIDFVQGQSKGHDKLGAPALLAITVANNP